MSQILLRAFTADTGSFVSYDERLTIPEELYETALEQMNKGVCHFVFTKKDGTLRTAIATLNRDLIPACTHKEFETLNGKYGRLLDSADKLANKTFAGADGQDLRTEIADAVDAYNAQKPTKSVKKSPEYFSCYDFTKAGWIQVHVDNVVCIIGVAK